MVKGAAPKEETSSSLSNLSEDHETSFEADPMKKATKYNEVKFSVSSDNEENDSDLEAWDTNDILVVSHASFMRQIFKFFVFDLKCDFPFCDKTLDNALVIPNTSVTKFSFGLETKLRKESELNYNNNRLKLKCHSFNEKEHMSKMQNLNKSNLSDL